MSDDYKKILWELIKPAIVAMIVAVLVTLGVWQEAGRLGDQLNGGIMAAGVSHFSSVYSEDDVQAVDDVIAGDDLTVGGASTFTGGLDVTGAATLNSTLDVDGGISSGTGLITLTTGLYNAQDLEHVMFPSVMSAAVTWESTGAVWTIAAGEIWIVHDVLIDVTTNFDATGDATLQVGDANDPNGLLDLVDAELQAADTEGTGFAAGWQGQLAATKGVYLTDSSFVYEGAETIDIACGGTALDAGAATLYLIYTRIQ